MLLPTTLIILLASRFATSAPISSPPPPSCIQGSCPPSLLRHLTKPHIALSPFSNLNDLAQPPPESSPFSNLNEPAPLTPSNAVSADKPLSSLYLTSLPGNTKEQQEQSTAELKQKGDENVHLHELPKTALANFWTSEHASRTHKPCHGRKGEGFIYLPGNIYIKSSQYISRRPDIAVVGIVLAFLGLVVVVEAAGRISECMKKTFGRTNECEGNGEIYLGSDDDNIVASAAKLEEPLAPQAFALPSEDEKSGSALEQV